MCGHKCAKYTLIAFNIVFWLMGASLLGVSIWALVDPEVVRLINVVAMDNSEALIKAASITLCVVGGVIFTMGFFGCCGALRESACILNTYASIVILLLLAQITAGVLAVIFKDKLLDNLASAMNTTVTQRYGLIGYETETEAYNFLQTQFSCCGVKEPYYEWTASEWAKYSKGQTVPDSCCVPEDPKADPPVPKDLHQCQVDARDPDIQDSEYYQHVGCYDAMYDWVVSHAALLMGVAFGLAALQIILIIFACCAKKRNRGDSDEPHGYDLVKT